MKKEKKQKLEAQEKVYYLGNFNHFEETEVVEINKTQNRAILKNKVIVFRKSERNLFSRPDGKEGYALKITEETQELYSKFLAFHQLKRSLESFQEKLKNGYQAQDLTQMQNLLESLK